jgi:protoporphyrinogen IX oxidase
VAYLWLKTFHIVGVVVWFAGLFYLVRLFVYHREAAERPSQEKEILSAQFSIMESRLLNIITTPGMVLTVGTASALLYLTPIWLEQRWMQAKLGLVALLVLYHFLCIQVMKSLQRGELKWSPKGLRALNEVPTLILVSVVMLVVFKTQFPMSANVWLNVGLVLSFIISIQLYAKKRKRDTERTISTRSKPD